MDVDNLNGDYDPNVGDILQFSDCKTTCIRKLNEASKLQCLIQTSGGCGF